MKIEPVHGEPALRMSGDGEKILVIADTHIGIESELLDAGFKIPIQSDEIIRQVMGICRRERPDRLVHLGDIKHNIPTAFFREKSAVAELVGSVLTVCKGIDIVAGNHDGMLEGMLGSVGQSGRVKVHRSGCLVIGDTALFHGHVWLPETAMLKKKLVMAHLHPAVRLVDTLGKGDSERCWARCSLDAGQARKHYPKTKVSKTSKVVVLPAFNKLCGSPLNPGKAFARRGGGPFVRNGLVNLCESDIYLLDGTCLGKLSDLPGFRPA